MDKLPILILDEEPQSYTHLLKQRWPALDIHCNGDGVGLAELAQAVQPRVVAMCKTDTFNWVDVRPIMRQPSVEWVHICGAGYDHIEPLSALNAQVTNAAGVLADYLAEAMLGMMIALSFCLPAYFDDQRAHRWQGRLRRTLIGSSVLIIGLGTIGRELARRCKAADMQVLGIRAGTAPVEHVDEQGTLDQLMEMLPRADYVCMHAPLNDSTRNLFGREAFAAMRPGSYFLNGARGHIVDEVALQEALESDHLAGAYSDVFAEEPLPQDSPLWDCKNLIITPHHSDAIVEWRERQGAFFIDNMARWLAGEPMKNLIYRPS